MTSNFGHLYDIALANMERTVHTLSLKVPAPRKVPFRDSFVFRHVEKTIQQAIIQKLARAASTLNAVRLLMEHGFYQEQGALQRMLDELNEDITFLSQAAGTGDVSPLHLEFLDAFYQEEFDSDTSLAATQKRPMVPRRKIQAYNARQMAPAVDPSTGAEMLRTISKTYSGYVHAASPHCMDMYGGFPPKFHVSGMKGSGREQAHREDLWNYFHRGIVTFALAANAFADRDLFNQIYKFSREFERLSGKDYS